MAGTVLIFYHGRALPLNMWRDVELNPVRTGLVKKNLKIGTGAVPHRTCEQKMLSL
jgi:hypothetical protein